VQALVSLFVFILTYTNIFGMDFINA